MRKRRRRYLRRADEYMEGGDATAHRRFDSQRVGYAYCTGDGCEWPCPAVELHEALVALPAPSPEGRQGGAT